MSNKVQLGLIVGCYKFAFALFGALLDKVGGISAKTNFKTAF